MLDEYKDLPPMYKAELTEKGQLIVTEVDPHVYRRIGTAGLGATPLKAAELLKARLLERLDEQLQAITWQARQYII